ncbi:hypothetical protein [Mycetocola spongiae]|uniref:hypothetical protein n=1 Tax=Mycetocola spongiae TaxID=2859226 RepID=UPI001CF3E76E|nr:hypothetical protein [Mycetocola spongiae]UCR88989.1 hypothetical protein KXZ72_13755 [Mycetocola spongiae]
MIATLLGWTLSVSPSPSPRTPGVAPDNNLVTPGVIGFLAIAFVAVAACFLVWDMMRRIRRTNYRAEIVERLEHEKEDLARAEAGLPALDREQPEPGETPPGK